MSDKMEHLNLDKILSYIENQINPPTPPFSKGGQGGFEIEAHLATCQRCYESYMGLRSVEDALKRSFKTEEATASCPEDWEISALIRGETPSDMSERLTSHIKDCGFCIDRAAVYYKALESEEMAISTPELWKQKAIATLKSDRIDTKVSVFQQISAFFKKIIPSLPPLPGYVAAALAILILIIWNVIPQKGKIITVASSEKIITRDSEIPSAYGFTGVGESREVKNMEILYKGKDIEFIWKPIDGAMEYEFSLRDKSGDKKVYSSHIDKKTIVSLKKDLFKRDRLYSWQITGKTKDGKYFEYTGDFIFVR
jgi:hypothetical protein